MTSFHILHDTFYSFLTLVGFFYQDILMVNAALFLKGSIAQIVRYSWMTPLSLLFSVLQSGKWNDQKNWTENASLDSGQRSQDFASRAGKK